MHKNIGIGDYFLIYLLSILICYYCSSTYIFTTLSILFTIAGISYLHYDKTYWQRQGVPAPEANFLFGNSLDINRDGVIKFDLKNFKRYGNTFGTYIFGRKVLDTMDLDIMKTVFVKEFTNFPNRYRIVFNSNSKMEKSSLIRNILSVVRGEDWKRVRNRVTPAFTTGKLKKLLPILNESTKKMCKVIREQYAAINEELPLKDTFGRLVLDEIGRAGFSLNLNTFDYEHEPEFVTQSRQVFGESKYLPQKRLFTTFMPFINFMLETILDYDYLKNPSHDFFRNFLNDLYEQRLGDPEADEKFNDIFQLLIHAVNETENTDGSKNFLNTIDKNDQDFVHKEMWTSGREKDMTKMELIAQGFIILVAGYDTTASTMQFAIFMLANYPEIQERLRDEIYSVMENEENVTYEHIRQMSYLKQVLQETLRMFPPAPKMNRECMADMTVKGIKICKGDTVNMPIYAMHHNPEHYPNPDIFDPERFSASEKAKRDPLTYLPFGCGPRNCIGMRFAEFQIYVALATLVRKFRFVRSPNSPELPIKFTSEDLKKPLEFILIHKKLFVNVETI